MTGITRVSKESIFSDLNHLEVVTTTSEKYADCFGFAEEEVFSALDVFGLSDRIQEVKAWYDGFTFGNRTDIYNPWSILNYLDKRRLAAYWANSGSNSLEGKLIREGSKNLKTVFERLLQGESMITEIDEQVIYDQLDNDEQAVWSLLHPDEKELDDTVKAALDQIEKQRYETMMAERGVSAEKIRKYGFAFSGKTVLIGSA